MVENAVNCQVSLVYLSSDGVSLLLAQLIEKIRDRRCLVDSFLHQESRFHKLLRTFPLYAVVYERTGLLGTREYAIRLMGQPSPVAKAAPLPAAA